jgi:hypothetical protein
MSSQAAIITHESVAAYFKEQLDCVCKTRKFELTGLTNFYVVNLLSSFMDSEKLFLPSDDARTRDLVPLAELMARASDAEADERARLLRHLGDSSLYIGGFFQDSLGRSNVDVNYYVSMGGKAYGELSGTFVGRDRQAMRRVFAELAGKFEKLVELLAEMADLNQGLAQSAQAVLRLYEKWLHTGSARLGARLRKQGVLGASGIKQ